MNIFFHCQESRNETLSLELNFFYLSAYDTICATRYVFIYVGAVSYFSSTFPKSAVDDGPSFELGKNPGYRKCDSISVKLPCSAFLWLSLLYLIKWFYL